MSLRKFLLSGSLVLLAVLAGLYHFKFSPPPAVALPSITPPAPAAAPAPVLTETAGPVIDWDQRIA